jgi:hypothetical protein
MTFSLATINYKGTPTPTIEVDGYYYPLAIVGPELLEPAPDRGLMNLFIDWGEV